jgi:hypothetical protein
MDMVDGILSIVTNIGKGMRCCINRAIDEANVSRICPDMNDVAKNTEVRYALLVNG